MKKSTLAEKLITTIPWVVAVAYLIPAPFIALQSSEGWGYLVLGAITFPASILLRNLHDLAHSIILGDPNNMNISMWSCELYKVVRFIIYVGGGTLWFFGIGLFLRWIARNIYRRW